MVKNWPFMRPRDCPFDWESPKCLGAFLHAWELEYGPLDLAHRDRHSHISRNTCCIMFYMWDENRTCHRPC